jgi:hypothetical protein
MDWAYLGWVLGSLILDWVGVSRENVLLSLLPSTLFLLLLFF